MIHRSIVSLFIMKGIMSSAPQRTSSNTAVGMLYHFGRNSRAGDFFGAQIPHGFLGFSSGPLFFAVLKDQRVSSMSIVLLCFYSVFLLFCFSMRPLDSSEELIDIWTWDWLKVPWPLGANQNMLDMLNHFATFKSTIHDVFQLFSQSQCLQNAFIWLLR